MSIDVLRNLDSQSQMNIYVDKSLSKRDQATTDLIFILEGEFTLLLGNHPVQMRTDDIVIINKFQKYELKSNSDTNLFFIFEISDTLLMQATNIDGLTFNCNSVESIDQKGFEELRNKINSIVELLLLREYKGNFLLFSFIYSLLNEVITNYSVHTNLYTKKDTRIREIIRYLYNHYFENLNLAVIAEQFYMDPGYFSKYFKKEVGLNYKDYLSNIRLFFAERDLKTTEKSIARIATDNGFSNVTSFNTLFKKIHHTTPSEYREKEKVPQHKIKADYSVEVVKRYEKYKEKKESYIQDKRKVPQVNMKHREGMIKPVWKELINVGHAEELLSEGMKNHLKSIQESISYRYVRIWGIFSEELYVNLHNAKILNYDKLDEVFDFLVNNDIYPWIELNKDKQSAKRPTLLDLESHSWVRIFSNFMEHIVNRYGMKVVKQWRFEMTLHNLYDKQEILKYRKAYTDTRRIIKKVSQTIQIGGPGLKLEFDNARTKKQLKVLEDLEFDFFSVMLYPYVSNQNREERNSQRITDPNYLSNRVKFLRDITVNLSNKKIYITEWNITVSNSNIINDTLYKGAYIVKNIMDIIGKVEGIGYWSASDIYHSSEQSTELLNGGSGLLTKHGIQKPALIAMRFFNEIEDMKIVSQGDNYLVCSLEEEIIVFVHNYIHPNQLYYLKDEDKITPNEVSKFFPNSKNIFNLRLENFKPANYEIRTYSCNQENGSIFDRWKEFGFAKNLRPSDLNYLKSKNLILMELSREEISSEIYEIQKKVDPNEFFIIHLREETKID